MPYLMLPDPWMEKNKKMQHDIEIFIDADLSINVEDLVYRALREFWEKKEGSPQ